MRDVALTLFIAGLLPFILKRPHWGVLAWTWIGLMSPHRLTFGFAATLPLAASVGLVTIVALALSREHKRVPMSSPVIVLIVLLLWMTVTTVFSINPDEAWPGWFKVMKVQLFILITLAAMQSADRIKALVWVSVLSLGFYGVKGGVYTLLTGGGGMVLGPQGSYIEGNTEIALALTMIIPLMRWLQLYSENRWVQRGLLVAMVLCAVAILGSYSRGGVIAIIAMVGFLWLKNRTKLIPALALILLAPVLFAFMPPEWHARMATITTYAEDSSAMGRINAWYFAANLAAERFLTGGGFEAFTPEAFMRWAPDPLDFHDAHSIWFEVLAEQGYLGLALFLLLWYFTWGTGRRIETLTQDRAELRWAADLGKMVQVSLVAYWVGGSFLGLAYWDLPYLLMTLLVLTQTVIVRHLYPNRGALRASGRSDVAAHDSIRARAHPDKSALTASERGTSR